MEPEDYRRLDRIMRWDIRVHQFSERERLILELVLDCSFALGRPSARIPKLEDFTDSTGISRGNVAGVLDRLMDARVLSAESMVYRALPRSQANVWGVRARLHVTRAAENLAALVRLQGITQTEYLENPPTLTSAVADVAAEMANAALVPDSGTVPISGTNFVPDSGTPNRRYTSDVLSTERKTSNVTSPVVPDSGTERASRVLRFVGERDFARWWSRWFEPGERFSDEIWGSAIDAGLRLWASKLRDGVPVRTTRGRALWDEVKREHSRLASLAAEAVQHPQTNQ